MINPKKPTTYEEQVDILIKRGCIIKDRSLCIEKLSSVNYYRFTAYFLPFKNKNNTYVDGTSFEKINNIYEFDRKLRNLLYSALEIIEISLRARLSYLHAHKYGPLGYLNPGNFNKNHKHNKFKENIDREIRRNSKVLFVKHHNDEYAGKFPIWVISELFSFGMISYFYSDLKTTDRKIIAAQYNVNFKDLSSWLRCLTDLRNICAHYGRLYYRIFSASPASLPLPPSKKCRLWGIMLVLKKVYPSDQKWNNEFLPLIKKLFSDYEDDIELYHLAFPKDWFEQLIR